MAPDYGVAIMGDCYPAGPFKEVYDKVTAGTAILGVSTEKLFSTMPEDYAGNYKAYLNDLVAKARTIATSKEEIKDHGPGDATFGDIARVLGLTPDDIDLSFKY